MKYLYWNSKQCVSAEVFADLITLSDADIVMISECAVRLTDVVSEVRKRHGRQLVIKSKATDRIQVLSSLQDLNRHELAKCSSRYSFYKYSPVLGRDQIICTVHLLSKMYAEPATQAFKALLLRNRIEEVEAHFNINETVVVGDFNFDPFEEAMVSLNGLNATMDRILASRGKRKFEDKSIEFFYNPCWNLLGDSITPTGSFHYKSSNSFRLQWHLFDQVIIRPSLIPHFRHDSLKIIAEIPFAKTSMGSILPQHSDHFALTFTID